MVKTPDGGKRNKDLPEVSVPLPLNLESRIWPRGLTDVFERWTSRWAELFSVLQAGPVELNALFLAVIRME